MTSSETSAELATLPGGSSRKRAALRISTLLGIVLAIASVVFVIQKIVVGWSDYGKIISEAQWGWLSVSVVLAVLGMSSMGLVWRKVIVTLGGQAGWRDVFAWYQLGNLGKYLPGGVWQILGRSELAVRGGLPRPVAYNSVALSMGATYLCATLVSVVLLPFALLNHARFGAQGWVFVLIPFGLAALHPSVLGRVLRIAERVLGKGVPPVVPPWLTSVGLVLWHTIPWLINGLATWFVALTFAPDAPILTVVFAGIVSWVIGFVVIVVPGGIGVREAAFTLIASMTLGSQLAMTVAVVSRLVFIVADVLGALVALIVRRWPASTKEVGSKVH